MNQLIELILRYRKFLVFLGLQIISLLLVIQNNVFQSAIAFTLFREMTGGLQNFYTLSTNYMTLQDVNAELAAENARLRELLVNQKIYIPQNIPTNTSLQYNFITAKVINSSIIYNHNYITIDKGSNDGVQPNMGVITTDGVVGKVKSCSPNFSVLYSVLHADIMVSSTIKKYKTTCFTKWEGKDARRAKVLYVARHVPVQVGDTILTSGFNNLYPENYMVGKVTRVNKTEENIYLDIEVALSTDFSKLAYVYVLKDKKKIELDSIQKVAMPKGED